MSLSRLALCVALGITPLAAQADQVDLSGPWYTFNTAAPDDAPPSCIPATQDVAHLVAINNGVNPVHIHTKDGKATKVVFGDDALATVFTRTPEACLQGYADRRSQFMQQMSTVHVEQDGDN
jgi:hypothetical protein